MRQDRDGYWHCCHSPRSVDRRTLASMATSSETPGHIGILLFDGVEELDAVGPWEVLSWWTRAYPEDGFTASTFSADGKAVTCNKGLVVQPHHSRHDLPAMAVLLHPGGDTRALSGDAEHLRWLREQRATVPLLT